MCSVIKRQLNNLSKSDYKTIRELSHVAKNLTNEAIYNYRQYYFDEGKYLSYYENYEIIKSSENYKTINTNIGQQILREVDSMFKSFFALTRKAKEEQYSFKECNIPHYLPKDGHATLVITKFTIKGDKFVLPFSKEYKKTHKSVEITIPSILVGKEIKEIRIIPRCNARFFEIQYTYEVEAIKENLDKTNVLAIDFGVNNLVTAVTNKGNSFIIDGKKLKSINQWYNKENARLQSIKDKQGLGEGLTNRQYMLANKRNNQVNDYMNKTARLVIDYCRENNIDTLIVGYNNEFQRSTSIGKQNNQNFVDIPFEKLRQKLEHLCEMYGIDYVEQEESYTSKASFWDKDEIPKYDEETPRKYKFSGNRVNRGLYKTADGLKFNADVNGALNILKKSNVVDLTDLYSRGEVDTPIRIKVN